MIYLDNGATSFQKPREVEMAMHWALSNCASVGRGGYRQAENAAKIVYACRELAGELFDAAPEQVVFTMNCTHGLNIAIRSLVRPGDRVAVSGFEHNAVMRPLYALGARPVIFGRKLFDWGNTLQELEKALQSGVKAAVFTQVSNVFGYVLPVEEMSTLCRRYRVPFIVDAAQGAGSCRVSLKDWGADFIAMPGHKGLLGPQGTGILLCAGNAEPLLYGGTGSHSEEHAMPGELPDRLEAGTINVTGIAGLLEGLRYLKRNGAENIGSREKELAAVLSRGMAQLDYQVFSGEHQSGTVSMGGNEDCELLAERLGAMGVAVRAGLHCAPLAHDSAGTLKTGTVRFSTGPFTTRRDVERTLEILGKIRVS